jgi:hypothetical protein
MPDGPMTAEQTAVADSLSRETIEKIDLSLLANAKPYGRKVAMLIGLAMMEPQLRVPGLPDLFYQGRVKELVKSGLLVAEGNLDYMRYSEVRLPRADI